MNLWSCSVYRNRIRKYLAANFQNRISALETIPTGVVIIPISQLPAVLQSAIAFQQQLYQMAQRQAQAQQLALREDWFSL